MNELIRVEGRSVEIDWEALLRRPLGDWTVDQKVVAMSVLDLVGKALGERADQLKVVVRTMASEGLGEAASATTRRFESGGVQVDVTQKAAQVKVDEAALMVLLERKAIAVLVCFDMVPRLNEARLEQLIASGILSDEEIRSFTVEKPSTPAVTVKKHVGGLTPKRLLEG